MKVLRVICRYIVGLVFILSSLTKAIDPVGVSLKVKEYLMAYGGLDLGDFTLYLAVALCVIEFVSGAAILTCVKIRLFSLVALLLTAVFTVLTFCSAQFNLVPDCGCFGDVVKLSAWGTFYKNIILIILCAIVYFSRKKYISFWGNPLQLILTLIYVGVAVALCAYSYRNLPPLDYTDFKPGTDLVEASQGSSIKYKTECIYEKNGVREVFELENLPDSTWSFVETISTVITGSEKEAAKTKFILRNMDNNPVTEDVLGNDNRPVALFSIYAPKIKKGYLDELKKIVAEELANNSADIYIVSALTPERTSELLSAISSSIEEWKNGTAKFDILYSDYKTLITLNRSNGGATFVQNGKVLSKLSASRIKEFKI